MENLPVKRPHILFLFSDTGGGHRSAVEAITEAIDLEFPGQMTTEMVDFFKEYAPPPLDLAPEIYPPLSRVPDLWALGYQLSDGRRRTRLFAEILWPYVRRSSHRLVKEHPSDLIVSVHQLSNAPIVRALPAERPKFMTVVTDMVSTHAFWFEKHADLVLVPTDAARQKALDYGLRPQQVRVVGQPVAERFCHPIGDQVALRQKLGWPLDVPILLMVGGGEGMGPIEKMALAINQSGLQVGLVVIAGRNQKLESRLREIPWKIPAFIYGFVREMPDFMQAADVLISKAGPGTISEAFIAGLPIILYSKMPGQEDGNVTYVVQEGAGVWASEPEELVTTLNDWVKYPERLKQVADNSRRLACPDASRRIAREIAGQVGITALHSSS